MVQSVLSTLQSSSIQLPLERLLLVSMRCVKIRI